MEDVSKLVTVTCPKHSETLTSGLFNFLASQRGVDVDVTWCGRSFRAHRLILDVFMSPEQIFQNVTSSSGIVLQSDLATSTSQNSHACDLSEETNQSPNISDNRNIVDSVLEFLYTGKVTLSRDSILELLKVARQLNLQMLVDAIEASRTNLQSITDQLTHTLCDVFVDISAPKEAAVDELLTAVGKTSPKRRKRTLVTSAKSSDDEGGAKTLSGERRVGQTYTTRAVVRSRQAATGLPTATVVASSRLSNTVSDSIVSESDPPQSESANSVKLPPIKRRRKATMQKCEHCDYQTVRRTLFLLHQATHDTSIEVFRCETCSRRFLSADLLSRHQLRHEGSIGNASAAADKPDRRALWRQKAVLQKCDCGYQTMRRTQFRLHQATHDQTIEVFRCETCSRRFLSPDLLARHKLKHINNPTNSTFDRRGLWREKAALKRCEHCDFKTFRKSQFMLHQAKHNSNIRVFRCDKCVSTRFLSEESLEKHRSTHSGEPDIYECDKCDYKSPNNYWYQVHLSGHDPNAATLKCDMCYRRFSSTEKLRRHKEFSHSGDPEVYHCQLCKFSSQNKRSYQQHLIIIHQINSKGETVPKRFKCDQCDYSCVYGGELKYHVTTKHLTEKPFKCELCSYASSRKGDVGQHVKAAHLNLKPHLCELCGQRCASQSSLEQHKRSHTGEKPYKCYWCPKAFSDPYSLKKHARLHTTNERPFVCHVCGNAFNRRDNLKVHLRNVHKTQMEPDALKLC